MPKGIGYPPQVPMGGMPQGQSMPPRGKNTPPPQMPGQSPGQMMGQGGKNMPPPQMPAPPQTPMPPGQAGGKSGRPPRQGGLMAMLSRLRGGQM